MKMKKEVAQEKEHVINVGLRKRAGNTASTNRGYRGSLHRQKRKTNSDERRGRSIYAFSIIGFIICSTLLVTLTGTVGASGTYYASPTGGGNGLSASSPFQIVNFWSVAQPGDTLILLDGTYKGANSMIVTAVDGTASSPITIKALHDGQAIIDGQGLYHTCYVDNSHYILEGFVAKNSKERCVRLIGCDDVIVRRVSGYNANPGTNDHVFATSDCSNVLFEDCAASGTGRHMFTALDSSYVTFRRCWARFTKHSYPGPRDGVVIYGSHHCLAENCVLTVDPLSEDEEVYAGISLVAVNTGQDAPSYNEFYGNVIYDWNTPYTNPSGVIIASQYNQITGNKLKNNVFVNAYYGSVIRNDDDFLIDQNTFVDNDYYGIYTAIYAGTVVTGILKNSILDGGVYGIYRSSGTLTHTYNDIYDFTTDYYGTSAGAGEVDINPNWPTSTYGKGAYLMRPSALKGYGEGGGNLGAEVLYRYVNGELTSTPLWPWPMEDRIFAESGISPTWDANGGIWKTLDGVYEVASTGTISGTLTDKDTGNPIAGATVSANAYSSTTDSAGKYTLSNIPVGAYTVTASKSGYLVQSRTNVLVVGGQTTTVNLQLTEVPASEPESDLIGEWHFDEGSGTTAIDSSGNSNDGTLKNMDPATAWVEGKNGYAVAFDATDDYIDCGNDDSLSINDALTIVAWVKPDAIADAQTIVYGGRTNYLLDLYSNNLRFHPDTRYGKSSSNTFTYSPGEWIQVSVTYSYSTGQGTFYKDGESIGSFTNAQTPAPYGNFMIGYYNPNLKFNGAIDEVKIYSRALTAEEIQADYEAGLDETTTGTISGTVSDKDTGNPVAGATVSANAYSSTTNSEGKYVLSNIPVGSYTVTASKSGYLVQSRTNVQVVGSQTTTVNIQLTEVPEPEPEPDLVGVWHFDEGSGTTALDSSGNSNDGTLKNMDLATAWVEGKNDYAVAFDATDDYIDCGNDDSLNINDAITIAAWVKPDVIADSQTIVYGGRTNYLLDLYSNKLQFHPDTRYDKSSSNTFTYSPVEWMHVSVTYSYSTGQGTFYKDGESIGSFTNTQTPAPYGNLMIGYYNTNLKFDGAIDEVKIYSRALSAEEIQADYETGLDDETPPTTEGDVSGTIVQASDESGIAGVTVDLMQEDTVVASTVTDSNGDYLITDVPPGEYTLNASKIRFWSDSTSATVIADETATADCTLWLKGDLNNNGVAADEDDLVMTSDATVGKITPGENYDLNENGRSADAADQAMMIDAAAGKIILE
jgi:hypothetical protein